MKPLTRRPVIPVIWDDQGLERISKIPVAFIYLQYGSIFTLEQTCQKIKASHPDTKVFFHIDLADGIATDKSGVRFARACGVDGLVTTRPTIIEAAKKENLETVLRGFLQDSRSLNRTIQIAQRCQPDWLDLLPGPVLPELIEEIQQHLPQPIIGGGFVRREEQVYQLLEAGCQAISTSTPDLWTLNRP